MVLGLRPASDQRADLVRDDNRETRARARGHSTRRVLADGELASVHAVFSVVMKSVHTAVMLISLARCGAPSSYLRMH